MKLYTTIPDVDCTALVTETNNFLSSQSVNSGGSLEFYQFPPGIVESLVYQIPSLFTTFVDKNLTIKSAVIVTMPAGYTENDNLRILGEETLLCIPLAMNAGVTITFFNEAENAELFTEFQEGGMMFSYYNRSDCVQADVYEHQLGVGVLLNKNIIMQVGNNTDRAVFLNVGFNEDLSSYFA